MAALTVVTWLLLLWYGAGIWRPAERGEAADRIRDVLFLAVSSSFALALVGLFYRPMCLGAAAVLALTAYRRNRAFQRGATFCVRDPIVAVLPLTATVAVTWPGIVRPLLEGDSLSYHLPNAAAWANAHSLWTTTTTYWWYPPGSELFASALFLIGGPTLLAVAGFGALLLLALRIEAFARRAELSGWSAGAVAAAVVTVPMIGLQGASLQNDVWLGAWTLECLWALTYDRSALSRSLAVCSIVKPVGFIYSVLFVALGSRSAWRRPAGFASTSQAEAAEIVTEAAQLGRTTRALLFALAVSVMLVIWVVHVAILWPNAIIPPVQTAYPRTASTLILAHGLPGATIFTKALVAQGAGTVLLFASVIVALFVGKSLERRQLPWIFAALFFVEPFGYDNGTPQLATGMSLRFLIPALVAGLAGGLSRAKRWSTPIGIAAAGLTVYQIRSIIDIFWNDANTHGMLPAAIAVGALYALRRKIPAPAPAIVIAAIFAYGVHLDDNPVRYYDASLGSNVAPSRLYDWLARNKPKRLVVSQPPSGSISVVLPQAFVANATDNPCAEAARLQALLVTAGAPLRSCGPQLFADAYATVYRGRP